MASRKVLYHGQPGTSSAEAYSSTNTVTTITAASVQNTTGGAVTLSVWITDDGVAVADASLVIEALSIPANSVVGLNELTQHVLGSGQELHVAASAGTALTLRISGATGT